MGGAQPREVDFRLVAATNQPIYEMIGVGSFRKDLLYRINTVEILLPPLRDRVEDIPLLLQFFLDHYSKKYNKGPFTVAASLIQTLRGYAWPGNIRELRFSTERAVILSDSSKIQETSLFINRQRNSRATPLEIVPLDEQEKRYILEVLDHYEGNVTRAAEALGLTRTAMYRRLNKYNIR